MIDSRRDVPTEGLFALARSPRAGVGIVLARGSALLALLLMAFATVASAMAAARIAAATNVNDLFFAGTRQPWVQTMIDQLGPERTSVVLYLVQRSYDAVIVATAVSPLFVWLLGSSAIHASARLAGIRRPYRPLLVLFAYATALTLVPASAATLLLGAGEGTGPRVASAIGWACLLWLGVIAFRAVQAHYVVSGDKAARILVIAIGLFYVIPLVLIALAAVAIVV
ncbi:MAG TPA: YIP1 family protein, partial [Candidatus Limnocylindrales bacterium]|nr:YIP1 family protein [Candidatus Limnocylindrales bacterium]